jgi:hypothetical protein
MPTLSPFDTNPGSGAAPALRALMPVVVILLLACGESATAVEQWQPADKLEGTWEWVSSLNTTTDALHTPESEGYNAELRFEAHSRSSGNFTFSRAGAPDVHGEFDVAYEDAPGNDIIIVDPGFDYVTRHAWLAVGADQLILNGVIESGFVSTYVRIPD